MFQQAHLYRPTCLCKKAGELAASWELVPLIAVLLLLQCVCVYTCWKKIRFLCYGCVKGATSIFNEGTSYAYYSFSEVRCFSFSLI